MSLYYDAIFMIERVHRHFLEVIKTILDRHGIQDINNVQALILYRIGSEEMTVGELTVRGFYLGSNVSYNVRKMTESGWLLQERSVHDRRSVRLKLSEKALGLQAKLKEEMDRQADKLPSIGVQAGDLTALTGTLRALEKYWAQLIDDAVMTVGGRDGWYS